MKQRKWIARACLSVVFSIVASMAWGGPQDQQQKPPYTPAEYNAFLTAHNETDARAKIKLLNDFAAKYPTSALVPGAYRDSYLTYYSMRNYSKTVEYADRLIAFGNKIAPAMRLEGLVARRPIARARLILHSKPLRPTRKQKMLPPRVCKRSADGKNRRI